jgi:hypothetical protein
VERATGPPAGQPVMGHLSDGWPGALLWSVAIVRRWTAAAAVLVAGTALVAASSCRQIAGIEDQPTTLLSTSACGLSFGTPDCASCASASCCAEATACASDTTCQPYESCIGECKGDTTCRSQCAIDHPPGLAPEVGPLSACIATHCENKCGLAATCGDLGAFQIPPDAAAGCQSCLTTNACVAEQACAKSSDCEVAWQQCVQACPTHDCAEECFIAHGSSTQTGSFVDAGPWPPFVNAINGVCGTSCKVGNWTCAGKISWPDPKAPEVKLTFQASEFVTPGPIGGLDVRVCTSLDPGCHSPLATGQTNADGTAVFTVPNPPDSEGLGLNGFLEVTSPDGGYVPTLVYWGFPLSEPTATVQWEFATPSETQQINSAIAGVTPDPQRGSIYVAVVDCSAGYPPHVQVATDLGDAGVTEIYGTTGDRTLTATDQSGLAFILNVPPTGNVRLTATPLGMDRPASVDSVQVRAGWITGIGMFPTP